MSWLLLTRQLFENYSVRLGVSPFLFSLGLGLEGKGDADESEDKDKEKDKDKQKDAASGAEEVRAEDQTGMSWFF